MEAAEYFTYHEPTEEQKPHYEAVRSYGLSMALVMLEHVPDGAERSAAFRKLRECVMTANAAIALEGKV